MMRTIASVIAGEGAASALRRATERLDEFVHHAVLRARSPFAGTAHAEIVNVSAASVSPRSGGVAVQLVSRLREERALRSVALLHPGGLELSTPFAHVRRVSGARDALAITGANAIHIEGTSEVDLAGVLRLIDSGIRVIVSVHDFSLFCARPHLLEQPFDRFCGYSHDLDRCERCLRQTWDLRGAVQAERRRLAGRVLESATAVIFPSRFLLETHRQLFDVRAMTAEVIEPAVATRGVTTGRERRGVACAGAVKRHKGGQVLREIAEMLAARSIDLHVFGGGDADLLRALRSAPNVVIHGYYRNGTLPSLLERHDIGLVLLPSIWPEAYCLALSEAWLGGAYVAAFDLGAPAERIRREGGGWLTPLGSGASGLVEIVERWSSGSLATRVPHTLPSPAGAARQHVDLYRRCELLP